MKIHKSTIGDYKMCPLRMKAVWIDGQKSSPPEIALVGTRFHRLVPKWFDCLDWNELKKQQTLEDVRQYMWSLLDTSVHPILTPMLINFVDYEILRYVEVRDKGPEYFLPLDQEFLIKTPAFESTVDAIFKVTRDFNCVHEWKTGDSWDVRRLRGELAFYSVLTNATKYQGTVTYISCFNANLGRSFLEKVHYNTVRAVKYWLSKIEKSVQTNNWPRNIGPWCRNCPKSQECLLEVVNIPHFETA